MTFNQSTLKKLLSIVGAASFLFLAPFPAQAAPTDSPTLPYVDALAQVIMPQPVPALTSISASSGAAGDSVTLTGSNFGTNKENSSVTVNGVVASTTAWSATSITITVPSATTGSIRVIRGGISSNGFNFTFSASTQCGVSITCLYVRDGATGTTCADWGSNACDQVPAMSAITRGSTIYVADGNYAATTFDKTASGSSVITVKKATIADHGAATGWLDTYGDGQAVWTAPLWFDTDYWTFDGASRTDFRSGYGFKVNNDNGSHHAIDGNNAIQVGDGGGPGTGNVNHITLRYVEVQGSGDRTGTYTDSAIKMATFDSTGTCSTSSNCPMEVSNYIGYCYLHNTGGTIVDVSDTDSFVLEQSWIAFNQSTSASHSEGLTLKGATINTTIRYNYLENIEGTAYISDPVGGAARFTNSNWAIYGNVLFFNQAEQQTPASGCGGTCPPATGNGPFDLHNWTVWTGYFYIFNNVFDSIDRAAANNADQVGLLLNDGAAGNPSAATLLIENNIWSNNRNDPHYTSGPGTNWGTEVWDYNAYYLSNPNTDDVSTHKSSSASNPYINVDYTSAAAMNFHLSTATTAGVTLSSPYNVDPDGVTRGADGTWDRGAYEKP